MLLQTNSYIVPRDKHEEHTRLMRRFKQVLQKLGCDQFEVYEQTGPSWIPGESGRCVQLMRFRDRKHQQHVQSLERTDPAAQAIITELAELINMPLQQQQGFFAAGFYQSVLQDREPAETPATPSGTTKTDPSPDANAPKPGML